MAWNGLKKVYENRSILTFLHICSPGGPKENLVNPKGSIFEKNPLFVYVRGSDLPRLLPKPPFAARKDFLAILKFASLRMVNKNSLIFAPGGLSNRPFHYNIPTITRPYPSLGRKYQALLQAGNCTLTNRLTLSVLGRISRLE